MSIIIKLARDSLGELQVSGVSYSLEIINLNRFLLIQHNTD